MSASPVSQTRAVKSRESSPAKGSKRLKSSEYLNKSSKKPFPLLIDELKTPKSELSASLAAGRAAVLRAKKRAEDFAKSSHTRKPDAKSSFYQVGKDHRLRSEDEAAGRIPYVDQTKADFYFRVLQELIETRNDQVQAESDFTFGVGELWSDDLSAMGTTHRALLEGIRLRQHSDLRDVNKPGSEHLAALREASVLADSTNPGDKADALDTEEDITNLVIRKGVQHAAERKQWLRKVSQDKAKVIKAKWEAMGAHLQDSKHLVGVTAWLSGKFSTQLCRYAPFKKQFGPTFSTDVIDKITNHLFEEFPNIPSSARWNGTVWFLILAGYKDLMPRWMRDSAFPSASEWRSETRQRPDTSLSEMEKQAGIIDTEDPLVLRADIDRLLRQILAQQQEKKKLIEQSGTLEREMTQIIKSKIDVIQSRMKLLPINVPPMLAPMMLVIESHLQKDNTTLAKAKERLERQVDKTDMQLRKVDSKLRTSTASGEPVLQKSIANIQEGFNAERMLSPLQRARSSPKAADSQVLLVSGNEDNDVLLMAGNDVDRPRSRERKVLTISIDNQDNEMPSPGHPKLEHSATPMPGKLLQSPKTSMDVMVPVGEEDEEEDEEAYAKDEFEGSDEIDKVSAPPSRINSAEAFALSQNLDGTSPGVDSVVEQGNEQDKEASAPAEVVETDGQVEITTMEGQGVSNTDGGDESHA